MGAVLNAMSVSPVLDHGLIASKVSFSRTGSSQLVLRLLDRFQREGSVPRVVETVNVPRLGREGDRQLSQMLEHGSGSVSVSSRVLFGAKNGCIRKVNSPSDGRVKTRE